MTEYERYKYQHNRGNNIHSSIVSKSWQDSDFDMLDNYIMQRQPQLKTIGTSKQIVIDKQSYDAFVERAAREISKAIKV